MPSSTPKQARTMRAAAHSPSFAKKIGIPQTVAREFVKEDKGRFAEGGHMKHESDKKMARKAPAAKPMKYAAGGLSAGHKAADGVARRGKTKATQVKMRKGGVC